MIQLETSTNSESSDSSPEVPLLMLYRTRNSSVADQLLTRRIRRGVTLLTKKKKLLFFVSVIPLLLPLLRGVALLTTIRSRRRRRRRRRRGVTLVRSSGYAATDTVMRHAACPDKHATQHIISSVDTISYVEQATQQHCG
jgi:hypothetical protein